jgi:hypothetical protein
MIAYPAVVVKRSVIAEDTASSTAGPAAAAG